jgi:Rieske Fe-S protein
MKSSEIAAGEGLVGNINGKSVAVYNSGSDLIVMDNTCPHMGCEVTWNSKDKVWECPCHGSTFEPAGGAITGPATSPLRRLDHKVENQELALI